MQKSGLDIEQAVEQSSLPAQNGSTQTPGTFLCKTLSRSHYTTEETIGFRFNDLSKSDKDNEIFKEKSQGQINPPQPRWCKVYSILFLALCATFAAGVGVGNINKSPSSSPHSVTPSPTVDVSLFESSSAEKAFLEETLVNSLDPVLFASPPPGEREKDELRLSILHEEIERDYAMLHNSDLEEENSYAWSIDGGDHGEGSSSALHRKLNRPSMFTPLTCNTQVDTAACTTTFSSLISTTPAGSPLIIPCGVCVQVDHQANNFVELASGLRIEGKLYFPPSASLIIRTTFVLVLGVLKMEVPTSGNIVKISLYGETNITFIPTTQNAAACSSSGCNIGKKGIAVAGGRLDIQGYAPQCPAWEKLKDVGRSGAPVSSVSNTCTGNQIINGNADAGTANWHGWGNPIMVVDGALKAYNRTSWAQSAFQFLPLTCFAPGQAWRLTAKVKLLNETTGAAIDCYPAFSGNYNCPLARLHSMPAQYFEEVRDMKMVWNKNGWSNFEAEFQVSPALMNGSTDLVLHMTGGPVGSAVYWDNIVLEPIHPLDQIQVSLASAACWTAGTELVITSHTRWNTDEQVVVVASSNPTTGFITLTKPIIRPITLADSPDFAVEVASLTRPIIFEADTSPTDNLIGGHLIMMNTPGVAQHIEGVAIRNFGQQGTLGRYPIHFHMCEAVPGSLVKKNVVRDSKQRCYVIHGAHEVTMEENVAYNTFGHCYFLEDGSEQNNTFTRNIGIKSAKATRLLSDQSRRIETDDIPSVFWISNPLNNFVGNIAAGSERFGFWFETHSIRGSSNYQLPVGFSAATERLGVFTDNEAHSCSDTAFTSYPPGWMPVSLATIVNLKVYRNQGRGMFLHVTRNLKFINGIVADNGPEGVFINRGDNITFVGTKIIGLTMGADRSALCRSEAGYPVRGLVIHPTKLAEFDNSGTINGLSLINVEINRWSPEETGCGPNAAAVSISETQSFTPVFSAPTSFTNVSIQGTWDGCLAQSIFVNDTVIELTDGSVTGSRGFLVQPGAKAFAGNCIPFGTCLDFCTGKCLRTIRFLTNSAGNAAKMVVTAANGQSHTYVGRFRGEDTGEPDTSFPFYPKHFAVSLPAGTYQISFLNAANELIFPEFVIPVLEKAPSCSGYVTEGDLTIMKPTITNARCGELIRNGDFNGGFAFWQNLRCTPVITNGMLVTTTRTNPKQNVLVQWLDTSCLQAGNIYNFTLDYRLVDASTMNVVNACDNADSCPMTVLNSGYFNASTGQLIEHWLELGKTELPYKTGTSFNKMSGSWTVTAAQVAASKVRITIINGDGNLIIDNVKLTQFNLASTIAPTQEPTLVPTSSPATKTPTQQSTTKTPTQQSTTKTPTQQSTTKTPTKQSTTKTPTKQPTTKTPTKQPTTKTPTKQPTTKTPTKQPTTKRPTIKIV